MKILIADSGSTKTDWALVDEQGNVMVTCKTQGVSPIHQSDAEILDVLCKELVLSEQPQEVFPTWNTFRAIISQIPQIITCITFLNITIFEAADAGSAFSK